MECTGAQSFNLSLHMGILLGGDLCKEKTLGKNPDHLEMIVFLVI